MKTIAASAMILTALAGSMGVGQPTPTEQPCSNRTLSGGYAFSLKGTNFALGGIQYVLVGQFTADGVGHFVGKGTQSVQGHVSRVTFAGDYALAADCSGTATFTFDGGVTAALDFFMADGGREMRFIDSNQTTLESGSATSVRNHP